MTCKKRKVCNICKAPFKMERGCYLEKRCPACRFLGISVHSDFPFKIIYKKMLLKDNFSAFHKWVFYPQTKFLSKIQSWYGYEPQYMESSEDIILEEEKNEMIMEILKEIKPREALAIEEIIIKDEELKIAGQILGVSRERARQIISCGIKKLKHPRLAKKLNNYVNGKT